MADSIRTTHQRTVAVRACLVDLVRVGAGHPHPHPHPHQVLAYFVYTSTATFVATLRKGDEVKPNCQVSRGRALLGVGVLTKGSGYLGVR